MAKNNKGICVITGPELATKNNIPTSLVVLLHGYGDDGEGFFPIAQELSHYLPNTHFICPDAIFPFEHSPFGRQWFSLNDRSESAMLKGLDEAELQLNKFIDSVLMRFSLNDSNLALLGFSQGAMVSMHVALRRAKRLAGVVSCSGMLVSPDSLSSKLKSSPPVSLIHGMQDEVVPFAALDLSRKALENNGIVVDVLSEPGLGHSISRKGIEFGAKALRSYLQYE